MRRSVVSGLEKSCHFRSGVDDVLSDAFELDGLRRRRLFVVCPILIVHLGRRGC